MAKGMNDVLSGSNQSDIKISLAEEAKNINLSIRPEYLKNNAASNIKINAPSEVSWKVCAHKSETTCLTFNRDGDIIYTGGADGIVRGWRVSDGKEVSEMAGLQKAVTSISASLDNEYVLASSFD